MFYELWGYPPNSDLILWWYPSSHVRFDPLHPPWFLAAGNHWDQWSPEIQKTSTATQTSWSLGYNQPWFIWQISYTYLCIHIHIYIYIHTYIYRDSYTSSTIFIFYPVDYVYMDFCQDTPTSTLWEWDASMGMGPLNVPYNAWQIHGPKKFKKSCLVTPKQHP